MNEQDPASPRAITKRKVVPRTTAVGSLLVIIGWFASILFYVLLLSGRYSLFQNITVTFASLAVSWVLIGLIWAFLGKS